MTCEACGKDDPAEPTREYKDGGHYHDQCAAESGLSERDMV